MSTKVWVGKRESDILTYNFFDVSITFWGSNTNNNHSFCTTERLKDNYGKAFTEYVLKLLLEYISADKNTEIHFYNNIFAYKLIRLEPSLKDYIVNINSKRIYDIARHKTLSRVWLQNTVEVPCYAYLSKHECQYSNLINKFPNYKKFIIQKSLSGGGEGTYLICADNCQKILANLDADDVYLVSPYYEDNISLSCHLLIDNKGITVFPVSKQLLRHEDNKIAYCGNKYLDNKDSLAIMTQKMVTDVGCKLQEIDYRGICGLDFIFSNNKLMLIEINPRYQGSSYLINAELKRKNLPSLFELNSISFNGAISKDIFEQISKLQISLESYAYAYKKNSSNIILNSPKNVQVFLDGLSNAHMYEEGVYLYRYLKNTK